MWGCWTIFCVSLYNHKPSNPTTNKTIGNRLENKILKGKHILGKRLPLGKHSCFQSIISKRLQEWELLKILE